MKFLAIFMTVLIFASGLDLCADTGSCASNETTEFHTLGKEKQAMSEMCSPFCNCASCAFSILVPEKIEHPGIVDALVDRYSYLLNASPLRINSSIWQPPRQLSFG